MQTSRARTARVLDVGKGDTKVDPLLVELELEKSVWVPSFPDLSGETPVVEDTEFVNLQVSDVRGRGLRLVTKLIWDSPRQLNDLDLHIYDERGKEIQRSTSPTGQPKSEELVSVRARSCEGFTVEVRGYRTLDTTATLRMWLKKS